MEDESVDSINTPRSVERRKQEWLEEERKRRERLEKLRRRQQSFDAQRSRLPAPPTPREEPVPSNEQLGGAATEEQTDASNDATLASSAASAAHRRLAASHRRSSQRGKTKTVAIEFTDITCAGSSPSSSPSTSRRLAGMQIHRQGPPSPGSSPGSSPASMRRGLVKPNAPKRSGVVWAEA